MAKMAKKEILSYNTNLRAEIETDVNEAPRARVHSVEWRKIMEGEPVEINPSIGHGYKIMTVDQWAGRWKRNDDFPECLNCNSKNTKEHHFTQLLAWNADLVQRKEDLGERATLHGLPNFTWRSYRDPDFKLPEEYEREKWEAMIAGQPVTV